MAQVPYTGAPTVTPEQSGTPYEHIDTPLAAFGGATAEATQRLGGAFDKTGNELYARAIAMQQLNQQAEAAEAVAKFTTAMGEKYANYRSLEGKAAVDGYQPYINDLNTTRESIGEGLTSDYARKAYLQESRSIQARSVFSAAAHAGDQQKHYYTGTIEASRQAAINGIGNDPTNEATYQANMKKLNAEADQMAIAKGWSKEQRDDYAMVGTSNAVYQRAVALSQTKPAAAKEFLDKAQQDKLITSDQYGAASKYIRSQIITVGTRVESSKIMSGESQAFGTQKVNVPNIMAATREIESGNNYQLDKTFRTEGKPDVRVIGAYSIRADNIAPWLKEAGMPAMSIEEFKNDTKAQDKLAAFKMNQYQEQYGNANEVARSWRGRANVDSYIGETEAQYLTKFNRALRKVSDGATVEKVTLDQAKKLYPDDPEAQEALVNRTATMHQKDRTQDRETTFNNKQKLDDALMPAPDGKLVTSLEQMSPEALDVYNNAQPSEKQRVQKILERNAKQDYAATEENQRDYRGWVGKMSSPYRTPDETNDILNHDFMSDNLPYPQRRELIQMQRKVFGGTLNSPQMTHALQVLKPMMVTSGIEPKNKEDYAVFMGSLHLMMQQKMQDKPGVKLTDDEIKDMGAGLIRNQSTKWLGIIPTQTPAYQMEVPEADRKQIVEAFGKARNREPTEVEIRSAYNARQYNLTQKKAQEPGPKPPRPE